MLPGPYMKEKTSRRADLPNSKSNASGLTARQFQNLIAPHLDANALRHSLDDSHKVLHFMPK